MRKLPKIDTYASEEFIEDVIEAILNTYPHMCLDVTGVAMARGMAEAVAAHLSKPGHNYLFTDIGEIRKVQETEFMDTYDQCQGFKVWVDKGEDDE